MIKALALLATLASTAGAQPNATQVLGDVQQFYTHTQQLSARFRQSVTNKAFGQTQQSDGDVWVQKPGSVRFDYQEKGKSKIGKSFLYDGTTAWMIDRVNLTYAQQQVSASALPAAMSFLTGGKQLAKDFAVALDASGTYGKTVLALTPKRPSAAYAKIFFVIADDHHVTQSVVIDSKGDTSKLEFFRQDTKTAQPAGFFTVSPAALKGFAKLH